MKNWVHYRSKNSPAELAEKGVIVTKKQEDKLAEYRDKNHKSKWQ
jgi:hypothetical protein